MLAGHRVVAMTLDLGESDGTAGAGASDALDEVKAKALALGAYDALLVDAKERFIDEMALPALRANALYEGIYPLSAALSRPLIAALLVETAHTLRRRRRGARLHGQRQRSSPHRARRARSRTPRSKRSHRCATSRSTGPTRSAYANANACRSVRPSQSPIRSTQICGAVRSKRACSKIRGRAPPEDAYAWTASAENQPAQPEHVEIVFENGVPQFDGLTGPAMVAALNVKAGAHGVGRIDMIEDRVIA